MTNDLTCPFSLKKFANMNVRSAIVILLTVFVHVNAQFPATLNITCSSIKNNTTVVSLTVNNVGASNTVTIQNKNCTNETGTHSFKCPTDKNITIELRSGNLSRNMIDGSHFKAYLVSCNRRINPYTQTVEASGNFSNDQQIITEEPVAFTQIVPENRKYKFQMAFENGNGPFTVGTSLTLKITHGANTNALPIQKILVLECNAIGSQSSTEKYALADTKGCKNDTDGLFIGDWIVDTSDFSAKHTLSAFRFESGNTVTITCKVRVCMDPHDKSDCNKPVCPKRSKRRANRQPMSDKTSHTSVQTQFEVYDSFVAMGNSAEGVRVIYSWTMVCCLFVSYFRIYC